MYAIYNNYYTCIVTLFEVWIIRDTIYILITYRPHDGLNAIAVMGEAGKHCTQKDGWKPAGKLMKSDLQLRGEEFFKLLTPPLFNLESSMNISALTFYEKKGVLWI